MTKRMNRGAVSQLFPAEKSFCVGSSSERRLRLMRGRRGQHLLAVCVLIVFAVGFLESRVTHLPSDRPLSGRRLMHITFRVSTCHPWGQLDLFNSVVQRISWNNLPVCYMCTFSTLINTDLCLTCATSFCLGAMFFFSCRALSLNAVCTDIHVLQSKSI